MEKIIYTKPNTLEPITKNSICKDLPWLLWHTNDSSEVKFRMYVNSDEHQRGINTPANARTNWTGFYFVSKEEAKEYLIDLIKKGYVIDRVTYGAGCEYVNYSKWILDLCGGPLYVLKFKNGHTAVFNNRQDFVESIEINNGNIIIATYNGAEVRWY